ncbi:ankyrin repeat domain-containing protein [Streptomyces sp. AM 2-1-1]|uniref:ankyrin repeat domain-containing protein n=1 Tax=Streptomyces sp. AM 2-1-1 TaxID=3028709 RepID=UPI0023BA1D95|nr:ankyrin repeat domain-containing protein [Streptomyces sp. AM 2-1-1]WEH42026.1 ankyrin repeat domain-containing protein [Streptomyces sp. AM 2-1-1]
MNRRRSKKLSGKLVAAVLTRDTASVRTLLRAGADPEAADAHGNTPLYIAAVQGDADVAEILLRAGARADTESGGWGSEGTPLCAAACWGSTEVVRVLLAAGADPRLREDHGTGRTPLEWARAAPWPETVVLLESAGAGRSDEAPRSEE